MCLSRLTLTTVAGVAVAFWVSVAPSVAGPINLAMSGRSRRLKARNMKRKAVLLVMVCGFYLFSTSAGVAEDKESKKEPQVFNVKDFGAVGDGEADDTEALQSAINEAIGAGTAVYIPRGTYCISKTIQVPLKTYGLTRALRITGEWAMIQATKEMDSVMHIDVASWLTLERLSLSGGGLAKHGLTAFKLSGRTVVLQQIAVDGAKSHGFVLEKCQGSTFRSCYAHLNGGDGWRLIDCNAAHFGSCSAMNNGGNGFTIAAKDFSAGCTLTGFWSERNKGHGVYVAPEVISPVILRDAWIEGNDLDGVRIGGVDAVLNGLGVTGSGKNGNRAIRLLKSAIGCHVTGCFVQYGADSKTYENIRVEADPQENYIVGHFHRQSRRHSAIEPEIVWKD